MLRAARVLLRRTRARSLTTAALVRRRRRTLTPVVAVRTTAAAAAPVRRLATAAAASDAVTASKAASASSTPINADVTATAAQQSHAVQSQRFRDATSDAALHGLSASEMVARATAALNAFLRYRVALRRQSAPSADGTGAAAAADAMTQLAVAETLSTKAIAAAGAGTAEAGDAYAARFAARFLLGRRASADIQSAARADLDTAIAMVAARLQSARTAAAAIATAAATLDTAATTAAATAPTATAAEASPSLAALESQLCALHSLKSLSLGSSGDASAAVKAQREAMTFTALRFRDRVLCALSLAVALGHESSAAKVLNPTAAGAAAAEADAILTRVIDRDLLPRASKMPVKPSSTAEAARVRFLSEALAVAYYRRGAARLYRRAAATKASKGAAPAPAPDPLPDLAAAISLCNALAATESADGTDAATIDGLPLWRTEPWHAADVRAASCRLRSAWHQSVTRDYAAAVKDCDAVLSHANTTGAAQKLNADVRLRKGMCLWQTAENVKGAYTHFAQSSAKPNGTAPTDEQAAAHSGLWLAVRGIRHIAASGAGKRPQAVPPPSRVPPATAVAEYERLVHMARVAFSSVVERSALAKTSAERGAVLQALEHRALMSAKLDDAKASATDFDLLLNNVPARTPEEVAGTALNAPTPGVASGAAWFWFATQLQVLARSGVAVGAPNARARCAVVYDKALQIADRARRELHSDNDKAQAEHLFVELQKARYFH